MEKGANALQGKYPLAGIYLHFAYAYMFVVSSLPKENSFAPMFYVTLFLVIYFFTFLVEKDTSSWIHS